MESKKPVTLSLCLIVKNEALTLPKLLENLIPHFDELNVTDTGSTDNTIEVLKSLIPEDKLKLSSFVWVDDFGAARAFNLEQTKAEWCMWLDADDMLSNPEELRLIAENCDRDGITAVMFKYHYLKDAEGNTTVLQWRERLFKNNGSYMWKGRLHETLVPVAKDAAAIRLSSVHVDHNTTLERIERSKLRNIDVLEKALEAEIAADTVDPRTLFNLGNAYYTVERYQEAINCYAAYIPKSGWREERYLARHRIALAMINLKDFDAAINMSFSAIKENPEYPDAYIDIGKAYFALETYDKALFWFKLAATLKYPDALPVANPLEYTAHLSWHIGHTLVKLLRFRDAISFFQTFEEWYPNNQECKDILLTLKEGADDSDAVKKIVEEAKENNTPDFWVTVPQKYLEYPEVLYLKNLIPTKETSSGQDIAIYCGKCIIPFDETSETNGGVGGSEEAVINMARELASKGNNVFVFGQPFSEHSIFDYENNGMINYRHFTDFNPRDKYDVFISWRMPSVMAIEVNAPKKYLWLHDCTPEEMILPIVDTTTKIMVLSKFHRSLYPNVPDEKFFITGNGINESDFPKTFPPKDVGTPYVINTSAPDRGLEILLKLWPRVLEKVPNAWLNWYYGWETFDALHKDNPERMAYKQSIKDLFIKTPRTSDMGRVDHKEIATQYYISKAWAYPTEFHETYCISAVKAQAAGCLPVTTNVGALSETVVKGTVIFTNKIYTDLSAQDEFVDALVSTLKTSYTKDTFNNLRAGVLPKFSWKETAAAWQKEFYGETTTGE